MKRIIILFIFLASSVFADEALNREERVVALTLLGEARGEGEKGIFAVGCVIQRRSWERELSPMRVCLEPFQFEPWSAGEGKIKKERELYYLWKSRRSGYARELARKICDKQVVLMDTTNGANHFCKVTSFPYWARGRKPLAVIGRHKFFKLPPPRKK